jgi:hypothetical protein
MLSLIVFTLVSVVIVAAKRDYTSIGVSRMFVERAEPLKVENGWQLKGEADRDAVVC